MADSNEVRRKDASLSDCTTLVRFLWTGGIKLVEIDRKMVAHTITQRKAYEWLERCKARKITRVTDERRAGHPSTSRTDEHIQRIDQGCPLNHVCTRCGNCGHRLYICTKSQGIKTLVYHKVWMPKPASIADVGIMSN